MRLFEHEGKLLLQQAGFTVPSGMVITDCSQLDAASLTFPVYAKVQLIAKNRAADSLIRQCSTLAEVTDFCTTWLHTTFREQPITEILVEESVADVQHPLYLALRWDTQSRGPLLLWSEEAGSGIEDRPDSMQQAVLSVVDPVFPQAAIALFGEKTLQSLWQAFFNNDATLVEINPLFYSKNGTIAADAKIELDDVAQFRHPDWETFSNRSEFNRPPTAMELAAKQINAMDHRGVAGASFFEFDGSIAIMASGGGASLLAMDALMATGLQPANYTEYSGNPSREKVAALTKLVLSKPNLEGLWVIGGNANFTDIFETLAGLMDGVEAAQPPVTFPIVVRRGGPRWEEAFAMVQERAKNLGLQITLFGPQDSMLDTVSVLVEQVQKKRQT